ncbi:hypothetical protein [Reinekea sp. G2M2-21]|nr:hypothetical protein [Reinekea sp. G2M2-21]
MAHNPVAKNVFKFYKPYQHETKKAKLKRGYRKHKARGVNDG